MSARELHLYLTDWADTQKAAQDQLARGDEDDDWL